MAFDIMRLVDDKTFVSPGSIGGKIKKYRELRGWTQKELGIKCGFSASSADVRIAQYEKNKKIPREKVLKDIADALEVDECTFFDADMLTYNRMYHALFDMEDLHGLHPVKKPDGYYLEFSGDTVLGQYITKHAFDSFLTMWYEKRQQYQSNDSDTLEDKVSKAKNYAIWKGEFPHNTAYETSEKMRDAVRMHQLQAEMDLLNAKMKNDQVLSDIDKALEDVMPDVRNTYKPVIMESDFIYLLKSAIEQGLCIERFSPEDSALPDYDTVHLLSVRTKDILNDSQKRGLFAGIVYAIETIQKYGINISRKITSRNNELFITYSYPASQLSYFANLWKRWDEMLYISERKGHWTDEELEGLETRFKEAITGENDVYLTSGRRPMTEEELRKF